MTIPGIDKASNTGKYDKAKEILKTVCVYFKLHPSVILSKGRGKVCVSEPRQICMFLIRKRTTLSLKDIGYVIGGRDYTTVIHNIQSIKDRISVEEFLTATVRQIESLL